MKAISRVSDAQWRAVEKTLPGTADRASVRARLEQIGRDKRTPKQLAAPHDEIAHACDRLIAQLLEANPDEARTDLVGQLRFRSTTAQEIAAAYRRKRQPMLA